MADVMGVVIGRSAFRRRAIDTSRITKRGKDAPAERVVDLGIDNIGTTVQAAVALNDKRSTEQFLLNHLDPMTDWFLETDTAMTTTQARLGRAAKAAALHHSMPYVRLLGRATELSRPQNHGARV